MKLSKIVALTIALFVMNAQAEPVVTVFGRRTNRIKKEGYRFFPYPFISAIPIAITEVVQELEPYRFTAKDKTDLEIQVQVTWTPDEHYAINFLNQGGEAGARNTLQAMIREALRRWASLDQTWGNATEASDKARKHLIRCLAGLPAEDTSERAKEIEAQVSLGGHTSQLNRWVSH